MPIGFKVHRRARVVDPSTAAQFAEIPVANVSDSMSRMFGAPPALRPMHDGSPLIGAALTVRTRPGDNLMVHKALDMAGHGDVVVVDADLTNAIIGELMAAHAEQRGLAGIIIYGAIRDSANIARGRFPVYANGVTHRGPYKDGPGEMNVPLSLGSLVIEPGDLVLGDADGVACVPYELINLVLKSARAKQIAEDKQMSAIRNGTVDRAWVDQELAQRGCELL